jgi:hypothetical protein
VPALDVLKVMATHGTRRQTPGQPLLKHFSSPPCRRLCCGHRWHTSTWRGRDTRPRTRWHPRSHGWTRPCTAVCVVCTSSAAAHGQPPTGCIARRAGLQHLQLTQTSSALLHTLCVHANARRLDTELSGTENCWGNDPEHSGLVAKNMQPCSMMLDMRMPPCAAARCRHSSPASGHCNLPSTATHYTEQGRQARSRVDKRGGVPCCDAPPYGVVATCALLDDGIVYCGCCTAEYCG